MYGGTAFVERVPAMRNVSAIIYTDGTGTCYFFSGTEEGTSQFLSYLFIPTFHPRLLSVRYSFSHPRRVPRDSVSLQCSPSFS